jgi:heme peroxidase
MKLYIAIVILLAGPLAVATALSPTPSKSEGKTRLPKMRRSIFSRLFTGWFALLNRIFPWHRMPTWMGLLNVLAFRIVLREKNLHDTETRSLDQGFDPATRDPHVLYERTVDGDYNDLQYPGMGCVGTRFGRNFPLKYTYPEEGEALMTPSPRTISSRLLARESFKPATTLNLLAAAWIQFQVHDWFNHGENQKGNDITIPLEEGDTWHENPMRIPRTATDPTRCPADDGRPPTYINHLTHWWDASGIYGCDRTGADKLRAKKDGKLIAENGRLPVDPATGISITGFSDNWWVGLGLLHTLFALEHNAICERLKLEYPTWTDDQLYAKARLINSALMAKIHTVEWTPGILGHPVLQVAMRANWWGLAEENLYKVFGRLSKSEEISGIPGSGVDHHGAPYALTEEFTAVYRLHPLIPDDLEFHSLQTGELLKRLTFPQVAFKDANSVIDDKVSVEDVLYSFGTSHPGAITLHNYPRFLRDLEKPNGERLDLAAIDVMRDRERGVPRYNQFRKLLHMKPARSFRQITSNRVWARELEEIYKDVDRVDLMVGMFAEDLPEGFGFSDTAFRIFILMASRRLKSDRFLASDFNVNVYTKVGMNWLDNNTMVSVLLRHYPELGATLRHSKNAFAPWAKTHKG